MVKFKVNDICEKDNMLVVCVEVEENKHSFSFPLSYKENHIVTAEPQWMSSIKEIIERRYDPETIIPKTIYGTKKYIGKDLNTDNIQDNSIKAVRQKLREKHKTHELMNQEKMEERAFYAKNGYPIKKEKIIIKPITRKHCEDGTCSL